MVLRLGIEVRHIFDYVLKQGWNAIVIQFHCTQRTSNYTPLSALIYNLFTYTHSRMNSTVDSKMIVNQMPKLLVTIKCFLV